MFSAYFFRSLSVNGNIFCLEGVTLKRKLYSILILCLAVFTAVFGFVSCKKDGNFKAEIVQSTQSVLEIYVEEVQGEVALYEVMKNLKEENKIEFVSEDSVFGQSLISINGVAHTADWSWYWASYTTDEENGTTEITVDGKTWYYSAAGISDLKVKAEERYMFRYIEYVYEG